MTREIKGFGFNDVIAAAKEKQEELQRQLAAMTPEELAEWKIAEGKRMQETEEILKNLRGPGFFELKL